MNSPGNAAGGDAAFVGGLSLGLDTDSLERSVVSLDLRNCFLRVETVGRIFGLAFLDFTVRDALGNQAVFANCSGRSCGRTSHTRAAQE